MMQPFIYKYRPQYLKDFQLDDDLHNILNTLINIDTLNILIVGDSGTGKTSLINSLIKEYYGDFYDKRNILLINSLKDQGISYYRYEVKTFCQSISYVENKKKIVILDDIDTINDQSQQVFRNCIDKYSSNVHFIASCSNMQKVIDSLQSRIFIIKINLLTVDKLSNILENICSKEKINISQEAKEFVLSISNNSVTILINYLEKFNLLSTFISYDLAIKICTNICFADLIKYTTLCNDYNNLKEAIELIYGIYDKGYSVMDILYNYFLFLKFTDLIDESKKYIVMKLLCKYITIFYNIHEDEIELALFTNNLIKVLAK